MSEKQTIRFGQHSLTVPARAQLKVGMKLTQEQAIAIAQAAGAAPLSLEQRVERAKAALTPAGPDAAVRERAASVEATMQASRRILGRSATHDPESVADRAAATRRALGL